uniref:KIND domain-containing protein n=1 Tax=Macrostomum lignano TaxID=282301 RepID=A0A1I8H4J5_9PLAT
LKPEKKSSNLSLVTKNASGDSSKSADLNCSACRAVSRAILTAIETAKSPPKAEDDKAKFARLSDAVERVCRHLPIYGRMQHQEKQDRWGLVTMTRDDGKPVDMEQIDADPGLGNWLRMRMTSSAQSISLNDLLKYKANDVTEDELWCLLYGSSCALQRVIKSSPRGPRCQLITPDSCELTSSGLVQFSNRPSASLSERAWLSGSADDPELEDYLPPEVPSLAELRRLLNAALSGESAAGRSLELVLLFSLGVTLSAVKAVSA